jgi:hypothetical protein
MLLLFSLVKWRGENSGAGGQAGRWRGDISSCFLAADGS